MSNPQLLSPQPTRSLKRKISLVDPSGETSDAPETGKKRKRYSSSPNEIQEWLEDLPSPIDRSRSDSYLLTLEAEQHQYRPRNANLRSTTAQPPGEGMSALPVHRPLSPQSLQRDGKSCTPVPSPIPLDLETTVASYAASESFTRASEPSLPATSSFAESKDDPKKSNRVALPTYREDLQNHNVFIDSYGKTMPEPVRSFATDLIQRKRNSPVLDEHQILFIQEELSEIANADEAATRQGFDTTRLFLTRPEYKSKIAIGGNIPFDQTALPYTRGLGFLPIVTPKPHLFYGYPRNSFDSIQAATIRHPRLHPLAHPTTASYFPFFLVEFKSVSRGGTRWVAENQNAGSGAHCVNAIETILGHTRDPKLPRKVIDSLAFSCVADGNSASLWVHWQEDEEDDAPSRFVSAELDSFSFRRMEDVQKFRDGVRNIVDYGTQERLIMIKETLAQILPLIPVWNAQDKLVKARRRAPHVDKEDDVSSERQSSRRKME